MAPPPTPPPRHRSGTTAPFTRLRRPRRFIQRHPASTSCLVLALLLLTLQTFLSGLTLHPSTHSVAELPRSALILTSHPDDEVMFFAPSVLALVAAGVQVYALCMSTGDADGLGDVRQEELVAAYATLGVDETRVAYVDDARLRDGMDQSWDPEVVVDHVKTYLASLQVDVDALMTFDSTGVSSHPNHMACHQASLLLRDRSSFRVIYSLRSSPLATKYLSLPSAIIDTSLSLLLRRHVSPSHHSYSNNNDDDESWPISIHALSSPLAYARSFVAMYRHASQLVWFRYCYIVLSKLMYANSLLRI